MDIILFIRIMVTLTFLILAVCGPIAIFQIASTSGTSRGVTGMTLTEILVIANFVFLLLTVIGGYMVIRTTVAKSEGVIQQRVREALTAENDLLQSRVKRLETENKRLNNLTLLIITSLKKMRGINLEINEDIITFRDAAGTHIIGLHTTDEPNA